MQWKGLKDCMSLDDDFGDVVEPLSISEKILENTTK